jgi:hypothetical protein
MSFQKMAFFNSNGIMDHGVLRGRTFWALCGVVKIIFAMVKIMF